jgi:hypothetical protein
VRAIVVAVPCDEGGHLLARPKEMGCCCVRFVEVRRLSRRVLRIQVREPVAHAGDVSELPGGRNRAQTLHELGDVAARHLAGIATFTNRESDEDLVLERGQQLLEAFQEGADVVLMLGCQRFHLGGLEREERPQAIQRPAKARRAPLHGDETLAEKSRLRRRHSNTPSRSAIS